MRREDEYKHLADRTRRRGYEEQNALMRAQWEILAATYLQLADQSKKIDDTGTYYERGPASRDGNNFVAIRRLGYFDHDN